MPKKSQRTMILLLMYLCFPTFLLAVDLFVQTDKGESYLVEVTAEETMQEIQNLIQDVFAMNVETQSWCWHDDSFSPSFLTVANDAKSKPSNKSARDTPRDYYREVTPEEKKDISFIIKTLAYESATSLWSKEQELNNAGDRVRQVHPLRFMEFVFLNEELKVGMHNMHQRKWVWDNFTRGMKESFDDEYALNNVSDQMIQEMAKNLKIDDSKLSELAKKKKWKEFIVVLIQTVPRQEGYDRYGI